MGCDGGTIPRRDELVRVKKKPEAVSIPNNTVLFSKSLNVFRKTKILNWHFNGNVAL